MNKYKLSYTSSFKREYGIVKKRGYNLSLLHDVIRELLLGNELPEKNRDHALTGNLKGYRECHILPDWLLVYHINENRLILSLTRTGSHSDLKF